MNQILLIALTIWAVTWEQYSCSCQQRPSKNYVDIKTMIQNPPDSIDRNLSDSEMIQNFQTKEEAIAFIEANRYMHFRWGFKLQQITEVPL